MRAERRPGRLIMAFVDGTPVWFWTGALVGVILAATLFWGGTVGVADNGEGRQLACVLGLDVSGTAQHGDGVGGDHVVLEWTPRSSPDDSCDQSGLASSHQLVVRVAMVMSWVVGLGAGLDLRVLGVLCVALAVAAVAAWARAVPGPAPVKAIGGLAVGAVLADGSVGPFFVSLYSDSVAIVALVGLIAAWVTHPTRSSRPMATASVLCLSSVVLVASSWRFAALAPVLALAFIFRGGLGGSRWARAGFRLTGIATAVLVMTVAFATVRSAGPEARADERGGAIPSNVSAPLDAAASTAERARFYLIHPGQLINLHREMATASATLRDGAYGNFPASADRIPGSTACRLCIVSNLVPATADAAWFLLPASWLVSFWLGLQLVVRARRVGDLSSRALGEVLVLLATLAATHHASTAVTSGTDDAIRNQLLTSVATALMVAVLVPAAWALYSLGKHLGLTPGRWRRLGARLAAMLVAPAQTSLADPRRAPVLLPVPVPARATPLPLTGLPELVPIALLASTPGVSSARLSTVRHVVSSRPARPHRCRTRTRRELAPGHGFRPPEANRVQCRAPPGNRSRAPPRSPSGVRGGRGPPRSPPLAGVSGSGFPRPPPTQTMTSRIRPLAALVVRQRSGRWWNGGAAGSGSAPGLRPTLTSGH